MKQRFQFLFLARTKVLRLYYSQQRHPIAPIVNINSFPQIHFISHWSSYRLIKHRRISISSTGIVSLVIKKKLKSSPHIRTTDSYLSPIAVNSVRKVGHLFTDLQEVQSQPNRGVRSGHGGCRLGNLCVGLDRVGSSR